MKILLVDKAAIDRGGAVAQGLSAINTYIGENQSDDMSAWSAPTSWAWSAKT